MLMYENFVEFSQTSRKTGISVLKKLYMSKNFDVTQKNVQITILSFAHDSKQLIQILCSE